jgi:mRNA-degrading endonuclease toxin of MazEF toxin-antitoxin module
VSEDEKKIDSSLGGAVAPGSAPLDASQVFAGDVVWMDVPRPSAAGHEQALQRPWIIVSSKARLHRPKMNLVVAVPLTSNLAIAERFRTTRIRMPVSELEVTDARWTPVESLALTEQVRSMSMERALFRAGRISQKALNSVRAAVRYILDL